jgi:hypothetical protein
MNVLRLFAIGWLKYVSVLDAFSQRRVLARRHRFGSLRHVNGDVLHTKRLLPTYINEIKTIAKRVAPSAASGV